MNIFNIQLTLKKFQALFIVFTDIVVINNNT